jgi:hypothetical protein
MLLKEWGGLLFGGKLSPFCEKYFENKNVFLQNHFLKKVAKNLSQLPRYEMVLKIV